LNIEQITIIKTPHSFKVLSFGEDLGEVAYHKSKNLLFREDTNQGDGRSCPKSQIPNFGLEIWSLEFGAWILQVVPFAFLPFI